MYPSANESNSGYGVVAITETAKKRKYENQIPADPFNLRSFASLRVDARADAWKRMGNDRKLRNDLLYCPAV